MPKGFEGFQKGHKICLGKKNAFKNAKIEIKCGNCGKVFKDYRRHKRKFCSRKCKRLPEKIKKVISQKMKGRKKSLKAYSFPKGENHPQWIKDRSKIKVGDRNLNDPLQRQWSQGVKSRDNWKCRINNKDCNGKVVAHHILCWRDFPELRYNINNGITLCQAHHPRKRAEEKRLIPFFQGLVPVSNELKFQENDLKNLDAR